MLTEEEIEHLILTQGFLTGSRAWGVAQPDSDYDYVLFSRDYFDIRRHIEQLPIKINQASYNHGIWVKINDKPYNLFTHSNKEVDDIIKTTNILKAFPQEKLYEKNKRVYLFEMIRAMVKSL